MIAGGLMLVEVIPQLRVRLVTAWVSPFHGTHHIVLVRLVYLRSLSVPWRPR
jgi:hypothetical protein